MCTVSESMLNSIKEFSVLRSECSGAEYQWLALAYFKSKQLSGNKNINFKTEINAHN